MRADLRLMEQVSSVSSSAGRYPVIAASVVFSQVDRDRNILVGPRVYVLQKTNSFTKYIIYRTSM